jgi:enamine deaminase RidA (YjgF/YER057c/UK114 family)
MPNASPEARIAELGLVLPDAPKPVAAYIPSRIAGNLLYVAGQIPFLNGTLIHKGKVGESISLEQGVACARQCTLNGLAVMRAGIAAAGMQDGLDRVKQVVRVGCFVACPPHFVDHPKVANGASELLLEVFGEAGRHARAAVGAPSQPLDAPGEVEFVVEIG